MNPFDLRWLWQAVRGRSLTLAIVFLLALLGISAPDLLRPILDPLDLPGWSAWIVSAIALWVLVRLEPVAIPSDRVRRRLALAVVLGALTMFWLSRGDDEHASMWSDPIPVASLGASCVPLQGMPLRAAA
ncbi:hypothetical protein TVNIR_0204 [Thioalkalivibrio nitratireducens DSM 14787]|uniref:Uncharacterized protein n=1 Tax=Thioalkalivibrio nitratireducens (strain DSM 14787 / UNIQEM 213 / ALEN2) TaxID=1255043 RepID=L0DSG9_THIND|nr:hypothetical protein [Thioalkalivibrio nitratireducens]AGA31915.1 hypothetical protein TVNIR_0204 [Thioalkalivibrio nitratireducens DSM 14787]